MKSKHDLNFIGMNFKVDVVLSKFRSMLSDKFHEISLFYRQIKMVTFVNSRDLSGTDLKLGQV